MMWLWFLLLGSGSTTVESQLLPGNNGTSECNNPGNFMCGDGVCLPDGWQCDGYPDCSDQSDEKGCPRVRSRCAPSFFSCSNGVHCIIGRFRCNGFRDCPDGSDEDNCTNPLVCSESRFKCRNGRCVDRSFLCNGQDNCQDNSDEELCLTTPAPGQDLVTLDYRLRYYPSITYAVIGSAVVFVLVVALLALVLHHQRKRSVLLPRGVRGSAHHHHHHHHQPLLLSRLVILDRGALDPPPGSPGPTGGPGSAAQNLQLLSERLGPSGSSMDAPPSYSQAVLDASRPPWFDLPPPPYLPDDEDLPSEAELPQYDDAQEPQSPTSTPLTRTEPSDRLTEESDRL